MKGTCGFSVYSTMPLHIVDAEALECLLDIDVIYHSNSLVKFEVISHREIVCREIKKIL